MPPSVAVGTNVLVVSLAAPSEDFFACRSDDAFLRFFAAWTGLPNSLGHPASIPERSLSCTISPFLFRRRFLSTSHVLLHLPPRLSRGRNARCDAAKQLLRASASSRLVDHSLDEEGTGVGADGQDFRRRHQGSSGGEGGEGMPLRLVRVRRGEKRGGIQTTGDRWVG